MPLLAQSRRAATTRAVLVVAMAGCAVLGPTSTLPPDTDYPVLVEPIEVRFERGGMAQFRMLNTSSETLVYNLCGDVLERRVAGGWVEEIGYGPPCPAIGLTLPPDTAITAGRVLDGGLPTGEYRLRVRFSQARGAGPDPVIRRSGEFAIVPPAA